MVLASHLGSRTWPRRRALPPKELMTVKEAAGYFSVLESSLLTAITLAGVPVQGKDSWGNDLYKREDIRELLQ